MCGLGFSNVTAIVPSHRKRKEELETVLRHLEMNGFKDIIVAEGEHMILNRYDAIQKAKNEIIYTQDDDCIISNIKQLVDLYDENKIVCNAKFDRMVYYNRLCEGKIALIGYGAIFNSSLIGHMYEYINKFGEDEILYREADRIFTWLNDKELIIADGYIQDFPCANTGMSTERDHYTSLYIAMDRLQQL